MSVLIKGMKPPKNCDECNWVWDCAHSEHIDGYEMLGGRPHGCPMIEVQPHGRLIDADAFKIRILQPFVRILQPFEGMNRDAPTNDAIAMGVNLAKAICLDVDGSPTIIPAEEEPQWRMN